MRKLLAMLAVILLASPGVPKVGAAEVTVDLFYRSLEPHGEWMETADYGYVWQPREIAEDWRPYTVGNWAYTDAGWTWVSEEPFGWATYHYGRWVRVEPTGWVWVPDTEWAPAWVSWRRSPKHIGWAPLPPEARFRKTVGIKAWADTYYDIGPEYYSFVEVRQFGSPRLARVVVPPRENVTIIRETKNITNITVVNNYVFNGGPEYEVIVRESAEPVRRLRIERRMDIDFGPRVVREDVLRTTVTGDTLRIVAPDVRFVSDARPSRVARRLDRVEVDRGWRVSNADRRQVEQLRAEIRKEAPKPPAELPPQPKFERAVAADTSSGRERERGGRQATDTERLGVPGTPARGQRSGPTVGAHGTDDAQQRRQTGESGQMARPGADQSATTPSAPAEEGKDKDRAKRREDAERQRTGTPGAATPSTAMPDAATPGSTTEPETTRPDAPTPKKERATERGKKRDRSQREQPQTPSATMPEGASGQAPTTATPEVDQPRKGRSERTDSPKERPQSSRERRTPDSDSERRGRDSVTSPQQSATAAPETEQPRKGRSERGSRGAESPATERPDVPERSPRAAMPGERSQASPERRGAREENNRPAEERSIRTQRGERSERGAGRPEATTGDRGQADRAQPRAGAPREEGGGRAERAERPQGGRERGQGGGERGGGRRGEGAGAERGEPAGVRER